MAGAEAASSIPQSKLCCLKGNIFLSPALPSVKLVILHASTYKYRFVSYKDIFAMFSFLLFRLSPFSMLPPHNPYAITHAEGTTLASLWIYAYLNKLDLILDIMITHSGRWIGNQDGLEMLQWHICREAGCLNQCTEHCAENNVVLIFKTERQREAWIFYLTLASLAIPFVNGQD